MANAITSKRRAKAISASIFLLGLAIILFQFDLWPSIMIVIGLALALRQYLLGKIRDMIISLLVFFGVFVTAQFNVSWDILLPVVFILGAIYVLVKEFWSHTEETEETEEDFEEDLNHEIEEENQSKKP
ncbi:MAG: hypothetical protein HY860_05055 [Chlamydiales bacterium]|nr:hypothetical protein [Chlamydiales bacterium]